MKSQQIIYFEHSVKLRRNYWYYESKIKILATIFIRMIFYYEDLVYFYFVIKLKFLIILMHLRYYISLYHLFCQQKSLYYVYNNFNMR
jgi:hypothetical protein